MTVQSHCQRKPFQSIKVIMSVRTMITCFQFRVLTLALRRGSSMKVVLVISLALNLQRLYVIGGNKKIRVKEMYKFSYLGALALHQILLWIWPKIKTLHLCCITRYLRMNCIVEVEQNFLFLLFLISFSHFRRFILSWQILTCKIIER